MDIDFATYIKEDIDFADGLQSILESFDLGKTAKLSNKLSRSQFYEKITKFMDDEDKENAENIIDYNDIIESYTFKDGDEFIMYFQRIHNYIEVHFHNLSKLELYQKTGSLGKISTVVFATIAKKVVEFMRTGRAGEIKIISPPDRAKLYKKIIDKVLDTHNIKYEHVRTTKTDDGVEFVYKPIPMKGFKSKNK